MTLIDAGAAGAATSIAQALTAAGRRPGDVRRIALTHFHEDHAGGAGEFAALSGARVLAHALDARIIRGGLPGPPPAFEVWERPLHAEMSRHLPPQPAEPVRPKEVTELSEGDVLPFGGGARVVHAPGHTDGSIALHLPEHGVLFTGDAVAASPVDGRVMLGVFNLDRRRAVASFERLAGLDADLACFGHGDPVVGHAATVLRASAEAYEEA